MKKMSTLFKVEHSGKYRNKTSIINEVRPENKWVYETGVPTRKWDGSACMIKNKVLYKRYDAKRGKVVPVGAIPCIKEPDSITGHFPHWVKVDESNNSDKWHVEAWKNTTENKKIDGTYELCGPKVNANHEKLDKHVLIRHGEEVLNITDFSFENIRNFLEVNELEGIVFHDSSGTDRMSKIRKTDFGIVR